MTYETLIIRWQKAALDLLRESRSSSNTERAAVYVQCANELQRLEDCAELQRLEEDEHAYGRTEWIPIYEEEEKQQ